MAGMQCNVWLGAEPVVGADVIKWIWVFGGERDVEVSILGCRNRRL